MLIIERRDTAKPRRIWAYSRPYGPFIRRNWAAKWANFGAWGRAGATTGRKTAPSAECIAGSPPGGDFYASWGGQRLEMP